MFVCIALRFEPACAFASDCGVQGSSVGREEVIGVGSAGAVVGRHHQLTLDTTTVAAQLFLVALLDRLVHPSFPSGRS